MKTCPKCEELNGNNRTDCYKCHTPLDSEKQYKMSYPAVNAQYKKKCPKCKRIYSSKEDVCPKCYEPLQVYNEKWSTQTPYNPYARAGKDRVASSGNTGLYVLSALIPLLGIILGCIYIGRREDSLGKGLITTGILSSILLSVIYFLIL